MFKIALIGTISVILLLAAGTIASAKGIGPTSSSNGRVVNDAGLVGRMTTGHTTASGGGATMPGSSGTMASHVADAANQMSSARAAQMAATAQAHMQAATGTDPAYAMQAMQAGSAGTGSGYMGTGSTGSAVTMMGSSTAGTGATGGTGSTTHMGATGTGTTRAGSGSMMGR
ncbi:MAG: hypothetical protein ACYC5F_08570 [Thermoleophilia bacterium]